MRGTGTKQQIFTEQPEWIKKIARECKSARVALGWSVECLGIKTGLGGGYISRFERGTKTNPTVWSITRIMEALSVRLDDTV